MLHIKSENEDPYCEVIHRFVKQEFPIFLTDNTDMLDAVTSAFIATSQTRQGPGPSPEGLVRIRSTIRTAIEHNDPIPVLVPWGSKKADNGLIDIAELGAIRMLESLQHRVTNYYAPGVRINVMIEDLGGFCLWRDDPTALSASQRYIKDFVQLTRILDVSHWLVAVPESDMATSATFDETAEVMFKLILPVLLTGSPAALEEAQQAGWKGDMPQAMVEFYLRQYIKMYPQYGRKEHTIKLAEYLAQSWARYRLGIKTFFSWNDWVQINFPLPIPGIPPYLGDKRLYYRTFPMRFTRTHVPPWRGKGLLVINGGEVTPRIVSPYEVPTNLHPHVITLDNGDQSVQVRSDYVLID